MQNNHFEPKELYSFITGVASTAISRRLQRKFREQHLEITIEQWTILYHLWKKDGISQQQLSEATYRDKPSVTRLVDNLEKLGLVERIGSKTDRRINKIFLTETGKKLETKTMQLANETLNEALTGVTQAQLNTSKAVLQLVFDNLK